MTSTVIIIGAGAAGLQAAELLAAEGCRVIVLEAAGEPGGRINTVHPAGFSGPVEGGAEFIHGELPLSLDLARAAGAILNPVKAQMTRDMGGASPATNEGLASAKGRPGDDAGDQPHDGADEPAHYEAGDLAHDGADEPAQDEAADGADDFEAFMGDDWGELMRKMDQLAADMPIADFMAKHFSADRYAALRESVRRFAEGYDLADLHRVSTRSLYREWSREGEDEEYRIAGGYRCLIDYLVAGLKRHGGELRLSSPVTDIAWNKGRVEVYTMSGKIYSADTLIVSVSLGILEKKLLRFSPGLPTIDAAVRQLGYGSVIKILLEFREAFWLKKKPKDQTLFVLSDQPVPTWWTQSDDGSRLITGWLAGSGMRRFQSLDPEARLKLCTESLAAIFSLDANQLKQHLVASHILDWAAAPFVSGGYSFDTVGAAEARAQLAQPVEDTLWFCGEALYEGEAPGTVEAALSSGRAVAEKIIARSQGAAGGR